MTETHWLARELVPRSKYHYFPESTYDTKEKTTSVCGRLTNEYGAPDMELWRDEEQPSSLCKFCKRFSLLLQLGE